jgi:hypothetical protein
MEATMQFIERVRSHNPFAMVSWKVGTSTRIKSFITGETNLFESLEEAITWGEFNSKS